MDIFITVVLESRRLVRGAPVRSTRIQEICVSPIRIFNTVISSKLMLILKYLFDHNILSLILISTRQSTFYERN